MTIDHLPDSWQAGEPYERFMGRWSRLMARAFIEWLSPPASLRWLDFGCGTGALSETILANASPASVLAVDPSAAFIAFAQHKLPDPRIVFQVSDIIHLPATPSPIDIAVSGLVLNFIPEPVAALRALRRALQPGGLVALYVWDYGGKMEMLRYFWDNVIALDPQARALDEGIRFPICQPQALKQTFEAADFKSIELGELEILMSFSDFADYWSPFLGGQGPAPAYIASLSEADREALAAHLRASLPFREDGSLHLVARAWAIRAKL